MYATQKNITRNAPKCHEPPCVVGRYLRYPDRTGKRVAEGGLRIRGSFKGSLPDLPLVTIITVCFNSAQTMEQCIRSVLGQTYPNVEYLIIDACSSDGTIDIVGQYEGAVDYFISEPDRGLYHAMNKGLELASGDFILVLNSDDWYDVSAIEQLVRAKRYAGTSFVSALAQAVDQDGRHVSVMRSMPFDDSVRLRMPLRHETMLISAAVYNRVGNYDESFPIIADYDLAVRMFDAGYTHYEVPRPLLYFRNTGVSNTNMENVLDERIRLLGKLFPFLSSDETMLLADRENHQGEQLLELARRHDHSQPLVRALHAYVADNAANGLQGRGRKQWRRGGRQMLTALREYRGRISPKVSVILPVFNGEKTLRACIDSVLVQTLGDFELICINDVSPDGSQAIISEYQIRDPRIVSLINEINIGHGASRNKGVQAAGGAYIFHIDPDDTIPPDALETLYRQAMEHGSDLVRGSYLRSQFHHGSSHYKPEIRHPLGHKKSLVNVRVADVPELLKTPEGHWACLYRAESARRVPYPEDLKMGQDSIFLCTILPAADSITIISHVVYNYLMNSQSAMNVFSFRKYMDVLEWRRRAFHVLNDSGLRELGVRLLRTYAHLPWHDQFFRHYAFSPDRGELNALGAALRAAYGEAGLDTIDEKAASHRREFLKLVLESKEDQAEMMLREQMVSASRPDSIWEPMTAGSRKTPQVSSRPKVSVILPIFKAEQTLRECLDSILAQSLPDFELICINDASPDSSQAIVDEYRARDTRIVSLINEVNIGHGASRNRGVAFARGDYIFHVDPDDTLPPRALESLYTHAVPHGSDMTKGAYLHEQLLFGRKNKKSERRGLKPGTPPITNTSLAAMPELLKTTEGHWSYLYKSEFAKKVFYPTDLKMGQDSIFIVDALVRARTISIIDEVVYHYRANPDSAMNTFTFRKYKDALEWRRRARHVLKDAGFEKIGDRLLQAYWSESFFRNLAMNTGSEQLREFLSRFRNSFLEAGITALTEKPPGFLADLFPMILSGNDDAAIALMGGSPLLSVVGPSTDRVESLAGSGRHVAMPSDSLRVATFCSLDHGGAGTGTQRRVEALRRNGVDARIFSLVVKSSHPYVERVVPDLPSVDVSRQTEVWREVRERAILPVRSIPGYCAVELFSCPDSVVDFRKMTGLFDAFDVIHFHWVVGMFDFQRAGDVLAGKPLVWTLADMNAFTGGCHYSEGCEEYRRKCRVCPLLGGTGKLAHENWKIKKAAYERLDNLHIICPSQWMADRAARSSLLGDRPIHHIPNAFPTDRLILTNKTVARAQLGLPVDKKLLLFGADSLQNHRKGSDLLSAMLERLAHLYPQISAEVVLFGNNSISLPFPVHTLGYISEDTRLGLAYSAVDAFLLPSREDNAPLTVGESLLCGTPVVAFPVGHVPSLVRHNVTGYVAKHLDIDDFARGIAWALSADQETAIKRGLLGRISATAFHDPQKAVERHLDVYQKVRSKGRSFNDCRVS